MYLEATGAVPGAKCRLMSPRIPLFYVDKCFKFDYHVMGQHIGGLAVLEDNYLQFKRIFEGSLLNIFQIINS